MQTKGNTSYENALQEVDNAIKYIKFASLFCEQLKDTCSVNSDKTMCLGIREALGVIFVDNLTETLLNFVYIVASAALFGNGILYKTHDALILKACKEFASLGIPVVTVEESYNCEPKYETIKVIWRIGQGCHPLEPVLNRSNVCWDDTYEEMKNTVLDEDLLRIRFSNVKNIWSTFGETFAN